MMLFMKKSRWPRCVNAVSWMIGGLEKEASQMFLQEMLCQCLRDVCHWNISKYSCHQNSTNLFYAYTIIKATKEPDLHKVFTVISNGALRCLCKVLFNEVQK